MNMSPTNNIWIRRQQCPCGDWKCYIRYDGDSDVMSSPSEWEKNNTPSSSEPMVTPYVGQIFKSDEEAFELYSNFARKNGFSIRKERSRGSQQMGIYRRDIVCYRSGYAPPRKKADVDHHRDRKSVRCGCDAKMYLSKEIVEGVTQWCVVQFSNIHNHELLDDDEVRLLPAYRKIEEADRERILLLSKAGFPVHRIVKVLELEKGVQPGQLPFIERDVRNFIQNRKKVVQENDALLIEKRENDVLELLEACKTMKEGDEDFVYDFTVDENDKIENIAWSYGDCIRAYSVFGDIVVFDTTYHSITYGMLLGVWIGIDNHGKTIFFGCFLLQDETSCSFAWALQTFVQFMKGKCPQTILTDLDLGLKDAITTALPNTIHVVCMWHILSKISSWFCLPLGSQYAEFQSEFDRLYRLESAEDFECQWNQLVSRFGLTSDKHIALLFSHRGSWALSYTRGHCFAQLMTTGYSKSIDAFLKRIMCAESSLQSFFEQVGNSANSQIQAEQEVQHVHVKTCMPIEEHASTILTPYAFNVLQHEIVLSVEYATSEMPNGSYLVRHYRKIDVEQLVIWIPEDEQVHCSCKEFELSGILCRHALRLLTVKNYFQLPEKYFPFRWRRESSLVLQDDLNIQSSNEEWFQAFHSVAETLCIESSLTKERSDYVHEELARLLKHVRSMPTTDKVASSLLPNLSSGC